jgi:hypothetical protein
VKGTDGDKGAAIVDKGDHALDEALIAFVIEGFKVCPFGEFWITCGLVE